MPSGLRLANRRQQLTVAQLALLGSFGRVAIRVSIVDRYLGGLGGAGGRAAFRLWLAALMVDGWFNALAMPALANPTNSGWCRSQSVAADRPPRQSAWRTPGNLDGRMLPGGD